MTALAMALLLLGQVEPVRPHNQDTGCGFRDNPIDASDVADWLDCQLLGL